MKSQVNSRDNNKKLVIEMDFARKEVFSVAVVIDDDSILEKDITDIWNGGSTKTTYSI